jgi:ATP-dependent Lhr-like helicase
MPGESRGAFFFRQLLTGDISEDALKEALWQLIWAGWITGDTFAPVRALLTGSRRPGIRKPGTPAHRHRRAPRLSRYSVAHPQARNADPAVAGRWSALPAAEPDSTVRSHFQAELLLGRYGVLTKGAVGVENIPGGFAMLYKVLTALEDAGRCQRGYFVESLGGAQFAVASTVDRLRTHAEDVDPEHRDFPALVLAAADPANPYGAGLPWPQRATVGDTESAHRPGRKAGALVALVNGSLAWFVERGGRSLLSFTDDQETHNAAAAALADLVTSKRVDALLVERINGAAVLDPAAASTAAGVTSALTAAGFARTPRGLRLR